MRDEVVRPWLGSGLGSLRKRKDSGSRGIRDVLFADRRSEFSAGGSLPPYNGSASFTGSLPSLLPITPNVPVPPSCGLGAPTTPARRMRRKGCRPTPRRPLSRSGISACSSRSTATLLFDSPTSGRTDITDFLASIPIPSPLRSAPTRAAAWRAASLTRRPTVPPRLRAPCPRARSTSQEDPRLPTPGRLCGPIRTSTPASSGTPKATAATTRFRRTLTRRLTRGPAIPRRLHLVEESGYEFGADRRPSPESGANGFRSERSARRDWGLSALNVTSQSSLSATYELPFRGAGRWRGRLIGGWQVNGIATMLTGFPFTPLLGSNRSGDGNTRNPDRPSLNPSFAGHVEKLGTQSQWFDLQCFRSSRGGYVGQFGARSICWAGLGGRGPVGVQERRDVRAFPLAIPVGVFQFIEPDQPGHAQRNRIFRDLY